MSRTNKVIKIIGLTIFILSVLVILALGIVGIFIYKNVNFEADERLFDSSRSFNSTSFYANEAVGNDYKPILIETSGNIRKSHYSLDEISGYVKAGFVAVEDKIFYEHDGVDFRRTLLAAVNYLLKRDKVFGASTITQQVVKNISGDNQQKLSRKISEIVRAFHIEQKYTKDEILEVYLNIIPMSENIYGIGSASKAYFGKEPNELTPAEAATLIGITNAPSAYNPYNNPNACKSKRDVVLGVMRTDGIITEAEYNEAINEPLEVIPRDEAEDRFDSWFVEVAIDEVVSDLALKYNITPSAARIMLLGGGYKVYTTMDIEAQKILEEYFENEKNFPAEISKGLNYAMTVIDSKTGDLSAVVGRVGKKRGNRLLNHATTPHIPASTLKPIALYAPLIDNGSINWATVFDDVPVEFHESDGEYREYPLNSPNVYDGLVTVKDALKNSKNTVAVRLCKMLGVNNVFQNLKNNFGIDSLIDSENGVTDKAIAPMALGQLGRGISLLKLTECYSSFVGDGVHRNARSYIALSDYNDNVVMTSKREENRVFKQSTARIMNQMLMTVTESGTASSIKLKSIVDTAGKTGTSSGNRDKMFVGYTPYYVSGIWCGYDRANGDVASLSKSHLAIWDDVMLKIHDKRLKEGVIESFSTDGLMYLPYCMDSGGIYSEVCVYDPRGTRRDFGYFTPDNQPNGPCGRHVLCLYDAQSKAVACEKCPKENLVGVSLISVSDRAFPKQIYVTDAEYVYRDIDAYVERPIDYTVPYFEYALDDGVFVGISKRKKQFNSNCYIHSD